MHKTTYLVGRLLVIAILLLAFGRFALAAVPAAPSNLTAEVLSSSQVRLTWQDNSYNEDAFEVWRAPMSDHVMRYVRIATLPPSTTTYNVWFPSACGHYLIYAVNEDGTSGSSNVVAVGTPLSPPVLVARAVSAHRIDLAWEDANYCHEGYEVWRMDALPYFSRWQPLATLPRDAASYADTAVSPGMTYSYRVEVYRGDVSESSNYAQAIAYAPANLIAMPVTSTRIDLAWEDGIDYEDGYTIQRSDWSWGVMQWGPWAAIADVPANTTGYADSGLASGSLHRYRVRAYVDGAQSAWSNVATAMAVDLPPLPPSDLTASSVSSSRIDLTWQDNSNDETGFKIERKPQGGSYSQIATVGADVTGYSSTGLSPATTYCYRVRACNEAGNSAYSNQSCATTSAVPPNGPSGLTAFAFSADRIDITWADNSDNEIGFKIGRKPERGVFAQIAVVGANTTSYSSMGLSPGTQYCYLVMAYNTAGNSTPSNEACATTPAGGEPPTSAPNAPSNLSAVAHSASRIDLSWNDNSDSEAGFHIERRLQGGSYAQITVVVSDVRSYADSDVSASTTYCYRVRAYNSVGESAYCSEACATTAGVVPNAPDNLDASSVSSSLIDLTWQDASSNETGFRIERRPQQGGSYAQIVMAAANATGYADMGLDTGTMYCYRVRACNATGDSGHCAEACAIAFAPDLVAGAASSSRIDLTWDDGLSYEDGYAVQRRTYATGVGWAGWVGIATVGPSVTDYADTTVASGGLYQYRVRAYTSGAESAWSDTATTSATALPPTGPGNLTAVAVSSTQVDLEWQDNANTEEGFKIDRAVGGGAFAQIGVVGANVTGYSDAGRTVNTRYCYRVRAFNAGGDSDPSNEVCATTADDTPPTPNPMTWSMPPHAVGTESVAMTATTATDPSGVEYFFEETSGNPGGDDSGWQGSPTYVDTGLQPGTEYCYRVAARDQSFLGNQAGWSSLGCASTGILGDIDGDGVMTLIDVVLLYRYVVGVVDLTADELARADIDGDGDVDEDDVEALAQLVFGP